MTDKSHLDRPGLLLLCAALLSAVSIWGSPFLYDYLNSGDYLVPMLHNVDPQLFAGDQVVTAMARFRSAFYVLLALAFRLAHVAPQRAEWWFYLLYVISKLLLMASIFSVTRALKKGPWLFVIFAAWCCHQKPALLGSVTLFMPYLTHNEVALMLGLFAVACLFRQRLVLFWLLAGIAVLIHVIVGLQFILCCLPPLVLRRQFSKGFFSGLTLFVISCVIFWLTLTPSPLSAPEGQVFFATIGRTGHISLFNQGWLNWFGFVAFLALALSAHARFTKDDPRCAFLAQAAIFGTLFGIALSLIAVFSGVLKLSLFQPMRIFLWVTLFCFLMLAVAVIEAFKTLRTAGIVISAALTLTVLNSILAPFLAFLGASYLVADRWITASAPQRGEALDKLLRVVVALSALGIATAWALGTRQPVNSLRSPVLLLPSLICLLALYLSRVRFEPQVLLAGPLLVYCLGAISVYRYHYYVRWTDPHWDAIKRWAQVHTQQSERFLTPPEDAGFRLVSLRSTASERLPRLVWVAPRAYLDNKQAADCAAQGYAPEGCHLDYLFALARGWKCNYVVTKGPCDAKVTPLFHSGSYSIVKVPEN